MKKRNRFKDKHSTEREIELFCQGTKEVLAKISERCGLKKTKSKKS